MKRIFTACIGLCLCVATVMAQDRMSRGQSAFNRGDYEEAVTQWEAAAVVDKSLASQARQKIAKANSCSSYLSTARNALRGGRYDAAESAFLKLKGLNPRDPNVSDGLARCKAGKAALAKEKEAGQYWNSIKDSWERGKYERYLAQYTDNKNAGDARDMLEKIDDKEAYTKACSVGTEEAYRSYLETSKWKLYEADANMALVNLEEERIWAQVKALNTLEGYEGYLKGHVLHAEEAKAAMVCLLQDGLLKDAQEQIGEKRYYAARKTLEKAVALGSFGTETGRLYTRLDEDVLYHECMEKKKYHFFGRDDCRRYIDVYGNLNPIRRAEVQKRLDRHNRLFGKDYDEFVRMGLSAFDLGGGNGGVFYGGPRVDFTLGSWDFPVNFTVSLGAYYHKGGHLDDSEAYELSYWQTPLQARLKINLFGSDEIKCYLAGGASYNFNYGLSNANNSSNEKFPDDLLHVTNTSAFGEMGINGRHFEVSFFYSKDLQPLFNEDVFRTHFGDHKLLGFDQHFGVKWAYCFSLK